MSPLSQDISTSEVPQGSIRMWWLAQAGFAFKTPAGKVVYVDPYLSDSVERLFGFKRLCVSPMAPEEVRADLVLLTHEHADHLDPDTIPAIDRNNPQCRFAGPSGCAEGFEQAGVAAGRKTFLDPNRAYDLECVSVHTVPADHGDYSTSALGLLLDFGGVRILVTGDTSLRPGLFQPLFDLKPDVVLPCINGGFGNMTHLDAARFVLQAQPRYAIPCHYWTFAEQGAGDPGGFVYTCKQFCPNVHALLLKPGEAFTVYRRES